MKCLFAKRLDVPLISAQGSPIEATIIRCGKPLVTGFNVVPQSKVTPALLRGLIELGTDNNLKPFLITTVVLETIIPQYPLMFDVRNILYCDNQGKEPRPPTTYLLNPNLYRECANPDIS